MVELYKINIFWGGIVKKNKTIVNIGGKEYTLTSEDSQEYIHRVAICVNNKMMELKQSCPTLNTASLAILTALNIADDYLKLKDGHQKTLEKYDSLCEENKNVNSEVELITENLKKLQVENSLLKEKSVSLVKSNLTKMG